MTYTTDDRHAVRLALLSIVSGVDLLDNRRNLGDDERASIRDHIKGSFEALDRLGVPYSVQNAAIGAGSCNNERRPASYIVRDILEQYADRLTPEGRREWYDFRAARLQGATI